jgi:hypothetical protein
LNPPRPGWNPHAPADNFKIHQSFPISRELRIRTERARFGSSRKNRADRPFAVDRFEKLAKPAVGQISTARAEPYALASTKHDLGGVGDIEAPRPLAHQKRKRDPTAAFRDATGIG